MQSKTQKTITALRFVLERLSFQPCKYKSLKRGLQGVGFLAKKARLNPLQRSNVRGSVFDKTRQMLILQKSKL